MLDDDLTTALATPRSATIDHELRVLAIQAELDAKPRGWRRLGRRGAIVGVLVVLLGCGATAATAGQEAWKLLFPPPTHHTYTFPSGVTCSFDMTVRADFANDGDHEAGVLEAQHFLETATLRKAAVDNAFADAGWAADTGQASPTPHFREAVAVGHALGDAVDADLRQHALLGTVSLESHSVCK